MSDFEQIIAEQIGDVIRITLNRPERLNAWTPKMMAEMTAVITDANQDKSVGAIVVTGAGRGFCAGADIGAQFAPGVEGREPEERPAERSAVDWVQLCRQSKPLIAAINGPAIGVGLTMVLPFDQLIAADDAKLSARFVKMGLVPELASSHFLVTRCGFGAASWLALSGTTILGDEAARLRLVDRAVSKENVVDEAMAMAAELAGNPPTQVRMIKELLSVNATEPDLTAVQRREGEALAIAYKTPEHHEAVRAFMEKRPPVFR
jgi:enoyl-CoA hydratase/carnithine racemase